ncbi:hypothetical protein OUZ56_025266 [Daphnia magna]|uniref:Uncharacterized protein n=1 Tax=Daphnia magna TaxID=35525 RepID=A0ABQ9ZJB5_9CRUS|nr:hypothetical protein OUZ56_025266 [Daphnia magna]
MKIKEERAKNIHIYIFRWFQGRYHSSILFQYGQKSDRRFEDNHQIIHLFKLAIKPKYDFVVR